MQQYHMRRKEREITDDGEIIAILEQGRFIVLALCRDSEPYIVTLSYGLDKARKAIYLHGAAEGLKMEFMRHNPRVCATVILDKGYLSNECGHRYATVVIRGQLIGVDTLEEKKHGIRIIMEHLEENPQPIAQRVLKQEGVYNGVTVLRLDIAGYTGKTGK